MERRIILVGLMVLLTAGCSEDTFNPDAQAIIDQCLRQTIFLECMGALPTGPSTTKYNDWDEVVEACGKRAYYGSHRQQRFVKPECRFGS